MSSVDIFYLALVLVGLCGFATSLAYFTQRDRLPKGQSFLRREAAPKEHPVKLDKAA